MEGSASRQNRSVAEAPAARSVNPRRTTSKWAIAWGGSVTRLQYGRDVTELGDLEKQALDAEKRRFLKMVSNVDGPKVPGWQERACADAITASARRAHLYRPGLTQSQRNRVRHGWSVVLMRLAHSYISRGSAPTQGQFDQDLLELHQVMNERHGESFYDVEHDGYSAGFRIAHAQKSLSLLLKHCWCNDAIDTPPCCPVDRRVLTIVGDRRPKWTDIDSMDSYRAKLAVLDVAARRYPGFRASLAVWELVVFNGSTS